MANSYTQEQVDSPETVAISVHTNIQWGWACKTWGEEFLAKQSKVRNLAPFFLINNPWSTISTRNHEQFQSWWTILWPLITGVFRTYPWSTLIVNFSDFTSTIREEWKVPRTRACRKAREGSQKNFNNEPWTISTLMNKSNANEHFWQNRRNESWKNKDSAYLYHESLNSQIMVSLPALRTVKSTNTVISLFILILVLTFPLPYVFQFISGVNTDEVN